MRIQSQVKTQDSDDSVQTKKCGKPTLLALLAFILLGTHVAAAGSEEGENYRNPVVGAKVTHGALPNWSPSEGWSGSTQQHTPGMRGMAPWTGARLGYGDGQGAHPMPMPVITQFVTDQNRLDAQKELLGISATQEKLWDAYVASVLTHNRLIQEIIRLSQTNANSAREHAELHAELDRTMMAHGTTLKAAYEKLLAGLPENKRTILNHSYEQVLYQHQQMARFISETYPLN